MSVKVTGFILIGLLPLQSSFLPLPAWLSSRTQASPAGAFIPRVARTPTHFGAALGISSVQGFVPSVAAPADSSPAAPSMPFANRHSPGFPSCHDARFDSEVFLRAEMLGSFAVLPARELAPLFRFQSSSGTRNSSLAPSAAHRQRLPLMTLGF